MGLQLTLTLVSCLAAAPLMAQQAAAANPLLGDVKTFFGLAKGNIVKSADKMPAENFTFKPSDDVRSFGAILAHVADANYGICAIAKGEKPPVTGIEKSKTERGDIVKALNESFGYCDSVIDGLTEAKALETVKFFGGERTRAGVLMFNTMHDMEHYGNLVTYMRMKGIVPPSSEGRR